MHHVFDADMQHLLRRDDKLVTNVTCLQPKEEGVAGVSEAMKYLFDRDEHANLPLREGRRCESGTCCEACSRVTFPTFATAAETDLEVFPELPDFNFNDCFTHEPRTVLHFVRLVERIRRTIAHEFAEIAVCIVYLGGVCLGRRALFP
jgi:hypothetical protein